MRATDRRAQSVESSGTVTIGCIELAEAPGAMTKLTKWSMIIGILVGLATLGVVITDGLTTVYDWFTLRPRIVVRDSTFLPLATGGEFTLRFSVVNRHEERIFLKEMYLVERPTTGVGDVTLGISKVPKAVDTVELSGLWFETSRAELSQEKGVPVSRSEIQHRIFAGRRVQMDPTDQLDYELKIEVVWPIDVSLGDLQRSRLPLALSVRWDDSDGDTHTSRDHLELPFKKPDTGAPG